MMTTGHFCYTGAALHKTLGILGQKASKWWVLNRSIIFYKTFNSRNFSHTAIFILSTTSTKILFSYIIIDLYCNELSTNHVTTLTSVPPWKKKKFWTAIAIYILKLFQNYKCSSHMMKFLNWVKTSHKYLTGIYSNS